MDPSVAYLYAFTLAAARTALSFFVLVTQLAPFSASYPEGTTMFLPLKRRAWTRQLLPLLCCLPALHCAVAPAETFELVSGDRVVFLGATFFEREVRYGCIETLLTAQFHENDLVFRNLAWSGDTVTGIARSSFDTEKQGYERLLNRVAEAEPTVIFVSYGQNESYEGEAGLKVFIDGLERLLDDLATHNARIVLVSPTLLENLGPPLPDPASHNTEVRRYTKAMGELAARRDHFFVDMTALLPVADAVTEHPRTDNGMHFTEAGYWDVAAALLKGLGLEASVPSQAKLAPLRAIILEKNRLFFNTWRAQNETYIHGFRKHEQGQNAVEIPQFLPLIAEQEAEIAALKLELFGVDQPKGLGTP